MDNPIFYLLAFVAVAFFISAVVKLICAINTMRYFRKLDKEKEKDNDILNS